MYIYPIIGGCQNRILIFLKTTKMIYSVRLKSKQPFYIWKKACHCASRLGTQTSSKFTNYSLNQGMQETSQRWADKNSLMLLAPHRFTFASLKSSPNQGMAHFLERCSIRTLCSSKRKNSIAVWSVCGCLFLLSTITRFRKHSRIYRFVRFNATVCLELRYSYYFSSVTLKKRQRIYYNLKQNSFWRNILTAHGSE